mmetsp:Transcript_62350/g.91393  ORF Transcript_62350/g.91393 Transcript_62350/m.91393 type:complete len:144 (-) Transcript_62350:64-495(-)
MQDLQTQIDYPYFDIEGCVKLFLEWKHNKHTDIMDFRNHAHRSLKTGTMAPIHHTPWLHALDDSMACYLNKVEGPIDPNLLKANEYIKILSQKLADSGIAVPSEPDMPLSNTVMPGAADLTSTSHSARRADYEGSTRIEVAPM